MMFTRRFRVVLVALVLAMPMIGVGSVAAQEQDFTPEAYTSALSTFDIAVTGPVYEITGAVLEHYANGEGEIVTIESEYVSIEVSFFDDADTPEQSIDAYIAGIENADVDFSILERGETATATYAIIAIQYEGIDVLYYLQVTEDVAGNVDQFETILTTIDTLESDLAEAQGEISIDGKPFLNGVNGADLAATASRSGAPATPESSAQPLIPATTVPFDAAAVQLELGEGFEIVGDPVIDGSIQAHMVGGNDTLTMVALGETGMTAEEAVESFASSLNDTYESVEPIDSRATSDTFWSLYRVDLGGAPRVVLVAADTATVPGFELLVASEMPAAEVAPSIRDIQSGIAIDGQPVLADIDADEISDLIDAGDEDVPTDLTETPVATETTDGTTARPRDDAKLPNDAGAGNTSEVNSTPEPTEDPVTQSTSSWEGPLLGHLVEWDASSWFVDLEDDSKIESDAADQYESITLTGDFSPIVTLFYVDLYGANDSTPADYLAYWTSDEFLQHETSSGEAFTGELISSDTQEGRAAVIIRYTNSDGDFFLIREAVMIGDGSIMLLTLDVPAADVATAYSASQDGVTIDAGPVFTVFTLEQVESLTGQ